jgi:hypothetical protein
MLNADVLTFREFVMHESLPLSKIHQTVLEFLQGREDVVLFGAQAVNAYISEPRMTQDVNLLSVRAEEFAEELRVFLGLKLFLTEQFLITVKVREVANEKSFRVFEERSEGNRNLANIRAVEILPNAETIENILVLSPLELIVSKIISYHSRRGKPKAGTDWRDLGFLLLRFPELKEKVMPNLLQKNVGAEVLETWAEIERQDFEFEDEDEDLIF